MKKLAIALMLGAAAITASAQITLCRLPAIRWT